MSNEYPPFSPDTAHLYEQIISDFHVSNFSDSELEIFVFRLLEVFCSPGILIDGTRDWWRGRVCDSANLEKEFIHTKDVAYNPTGKPNRCNKLGQKVIYAGRNQETTFTECDINEGDSIVCARLKTKTKTSNVLGIVIGELEHAVKSNISQVNVPNPFIMISKYWQSRGFHPTFIPYIQLIDAFFAAQFRKRQTESDYRFTQTLSSFLFNHYEAIIYPSVLYRAGMNIAVRYDIFDNKMHISNCICYRLLKVYPFNIHLAEIEAVSNTIPRAQNCIKWIREKSEIQTRLISPGNPMLRKNLSTHSAGYIWTEFKDNNFTRYWQHPGTHEITPLKILKNLK